MTSSFLFTSEHCHMSGRKIIDYALALSVKKYRKLCVLLFMLSNASPLSFLLMFLTVLFCSCGPNKLPPTFCNAIGSSYHLSFLIFMKKIFDIMAFAYVCKYFQAYYNQQFHQKGFRNVKHRYCIFLPIHRFGELETSSGLAIILTIILFCCP